MSRINVVREIKQKNSTNRTALANNKDLKREKGWDNRFYLGKIPTYNPRKQSIIQFIYFIRRFSVIVFKVSIIFQAKTKEIKFKQNNKNTFNIWKYRIFFCKR